MRDKIKDIFIEKYKEALTEIRDNPCMCPKGNADIAREALAEPKNYILDSVPEGVNIVVGVSIYGDIAIREVYDKWKDDSFCEPTHHCFVEFLGDMWKAIKKYCEEE